MLVGFYAAWRWFGMESAQAIPLVAVAVGLRYLTFKAMFGANAFLLLGAAFIAAGSAAFVIGSGSVTGLVALLLGVTEMAVFAALYRAWRRPARAGA